MVEQVRSDCKCYSKLASHNNKAVVVLQYPNYSLFLASGPVSAGESMGKHLNVVEDIVYYLAN